MQKSFNFVYLTTNLINGKQYIGDHTTDNIDDGYLGSGKYFLRALKHFQKEKFNRQILEFFESKEDAFAAQEKYICMYNTLSPNGYNISPKGGLHVKGCHSDDTRKLMSQKQQGKKLSEKHINNLKKAWEKRKIEKPVSEETKEKISKGNKNKIVSKEAREKISNSLKNHIVEHSTKIKISNKNKGKESPMKGKKHSIETKLKIKDNLPDKSGEKNPFFGKSHSVETKIKIQKKLQGKKQSEESRKKRSIKMKLMWEKRKKDI